jgi:hypothetical protein
MGKLDFQKILNNHKKEDGTFDFEAANEEANSQLNGIIAKKKTSFDEGIADQLATAKQEATQSFIKSLNLENVSNEDQFKAYVKNTGANSSELSEKVTRLTGELDAKNQTLESIIGERDTFKKQVTGFETHSAIRKAGFKEEYIDDVLALSNGKVTEDNSLEDVLGSIGERHSAWKTDTKPAKKIIIKDKNADALSPEDEAEKAEMRKLAGL